MKKLKLCDTTEEYTPYRNMLDIINPPKKPEPVKLVTSFRIERPATPLESDIDFFDNDILDYSLDFFK